MYIYDHTRTIHYYNSSWERGSPLLERLNIYIYTKLEGIIRQEGKYTQTIDYKIVLRIQDHYTHRKSGLS